MTASSTPVYPTRDFEDYLAFMDFFEDHGWFDGLPLVPPTPSAVEEMLAAAGLNGPEVLGTVAQRQRSLTAWQAATFAVMAGCRPAYFPVVTATWEALFDPRYNLHGALSSTGGAAVAAVVSGPYGKRIGMNAQGNLLGPGNRANASTGRAIRLGAMIALNAMPGGLDASSISHGGKLSMHFAEDTPPLPWKPIHEQLGYSSEVTTVTVLATEGPRQIAQRLNPDPAGLLRTIAACMKNPSQNGTGKGTYYIIILGPEHAGMLVESGWTQDAVRDFLASESRVTPEELAAAGVLLDNSGGYHMEPDEQGTLPTVQAPHILLVTAGGGGAGFSAAIPCWSGTISTHPVTRPIRLPGQDEPVATGDSSVDYL